MTYATVSVFTLFAGAVALMACDGSGTPGGAGGGTPSSGSTATTSSSSGGSSTDVVVNLGGPLQVMDGFGAADVWMGALTDAQADLFFDVNKGIGLSMLRIGINESGQIWSTWTNPQLAAARGAIVWAAPWSPPATCKTNGSVDNGGNLSTSNNCPTSWATTLAGFVDTATQNNVTLYGISAQNEPDFTASYDSCLYSGAQMVAWVNVLGPALHAKNVKLIAAEPDLWSDLWGGANDYGNAILNDAKAVTNVDVLATHQYGDGAVTAPPAGVTKHIWETEASGVQGSTQAGPSSDISNGLAVAQWIHDAIVTGGASAWHYWWLISINNDNEGLLLEGGNGTTKRLYTMGNFSKFVRPGYQRVTLSGAVPTGVSMTAYSNASDGTVAIVAINTNTTSSAVTFAVTGGTAPSSMTPWVTSATSDLASQTAVAVAGGTFGATLAAQSVTTFVGKP